MIRLTLHIWNQPAPDAVGHFDRYDLQGEPQTLLQEALQDPSARERLTKSEASGCAILCNGIPQPPDPENPLLETPLSELMDAGASAGDAWIEPCRARALPVCEDLIWSRAPLLRIQEEARKWGAPQSACIACGACIAACPNASAQFFCAAQGVETSDAARSLSQLAESLGFGFCSGFGECILACPKGFQLDQLIKFRRMAR